MILGIDIGIGGGVAWVDDQGGLVDCVPMPTLQRQVGKTKRNTVSAPLLTVLLRENYRDQVRRVLIEEVGPRPKEGSVQAFSFGRSAGVVEGVVVALGLPVERIRAQEWKRAVGLPAKATKDESRHLAMALWPQHTERFTRKKDDGIAEAALIAHAGTRSAE